MTFVENVVGDEHVAHRILCSLGHLVQMVEDRVKQNPNQPRSTIHKQSLRQISYSGDAGLLSLPIALAWTAGVEHNHGIHPCV